MIVADWSWVHLVTHPDVQRRSAHLWGTVACTVCEQQCALDYWRHEDGAVHCPTCHETWGVSTHSVTSNDPVKSGQGVPRP